jgi:DNA-binding NarL/FixJ family response regulator
MSGAVRVLIADDHPVVRSGIRGMLEPNPGFEVVGEASSGTEAVVLALALTLTGTLHHIFLTRQQGTLGPAEQARRVAAALITPAAANS